MSIVRYVRMVRRSHFFAVFFRFVLRRSLATRSRPNTTSLLGVTELQLALFWMSIGLWACSGTFAVMLSSFLSLLTRLLDTWCRCLWGDSDRASTFYGFIDGSLRGAIDVSFIVVMYLLGRCLWSGSFNSSETANEYGTSAKRTLTRLTSILIVLCARRQVFRVVRHM